MSVRRRNTAVSYTHLDVYKRQMEERSEIVYVNASSLNIRTEPGSDSQIIGRAGRGSELKRTGYSQSWSRVEYQGQVCYAASQYLTTSQPSVQTVGGGSSEGTAAGSAGSVDAGVQNGSAEEIRLNPEWKYAGYSKINSGVARLYVSEAAARKGKVVCVNACLLYTSKALQAVGNPDSFGAGQNI